MQQRRLRDFEYLRAEDKPGMSVRYNDVEGSVNSQPAQKSG